MPLQRRARRDRRDVRFSVRAVALAGAVAVHAGPSAHGRKHRRWSVLTSPFLLPAVVVRAAAGPVGSRQSRDVSPRRGRRLRNRVDGRHAAGQRHPGRPQRRRPRQPVIAAAALRGAGCAHVPGRVEPLSTCRRTRARTSPAHNPKTTCRVHRYRPDLAGGPLHLINVLANQSVDRRSGRRTHDRPGENMAVGPCGVSVGPSSHGLWLTGRGRRGRRRAPGRRRRVTGAVHAAPRFAERHADRCADERHAAQRMDVDFGCGVVTRRVLGHELRQESDLRSGECARGFLVGQRHRRWRSSR